jgi:hypothetical protein
MADTLTEAEQAAIAAYRGPITVIPRGVQSEAGIAFMYGLHWKSHNEIARKAFGRAQQFRALKAREEQPTKPVAVALAARREEVLRMARAGRLNTDIAIALGISLCTLKGDVRFLKAAGQFPSQDERQSARAAA